MSSCVRFAAVLLWWFAGSAYPQFDPAFGIDGHASAGFAPAIVRATGATVVTPSGAVYLIGTVRNPSALGLATAIAVARLTPAGTLDPAFANGGRSTYPIAPTADIVVRAALDSGGRLLLVLQSSYVLTVLRVRSDGLLDPDYGAGGLAVVANAFPTGPYMYPVLTDIAIDAEDRIVVLTSMRSSFPPNGWDGLLFRLTSAGAIDTSFGTGGSTLLAYGGNWLEEPRQLLRDPAGGLYVGMQSGPAAGGGPVYWDALLVKLDPDGHVDPVFGIDGIARLSAVTGENLFVQGLAADAANRIYMLVYDLVYTPTSTSYYVVRFDAGGTRDAAFGDAGRLALPPHPSTGFSGYRALGVDGGDNLLLQFDDSTYAAPFRTGLLRMSATGTLDQGFGTGGVLVDSSPGLNENWNPLRIDPQRGAVVAGTLDPPDHVTDLIAFRVPLGDFARIDLVSSAPVATKDASVNFTATPNLGGLTGALEFRANGAVIAGCAAVALVDSAATCQAGALPIGANLIVARYVNDPVKPDYHSPAIEQIVKPAGVVLDIDDDGVCDALTDGVLLARYLSGLRETGLVEGVLGTAASRSTGPAVADYLSTLGTLLDVDGDGQFDPLRDGLLVMRYLFGLRGPGLIADGIAPQGRRQSATDIETYLSHLVQ